MLRECEKRTEFALPPLEGKYRNIQQGRLAPCVAEGWAGFVYEDVNERQSGV